MEKMRIAVVGFGNVGRCAVEAVQAAPDMELAGVVMKDLAALPAELAGINVATKVADLGVVDAAILCLPTRSVCGVAVELLEAGIHTVDSFDIHENIVSHRKTLGETAAKHNAVAVVAAGWDPGTDSVIRTLLLAMAPAGVTFTNFGPGMSMGHTVAVKSIEGVSDALSVTMPDGAGVHKRVVYVSLKPGADFEDVSQKIKSDTYFLKDHTTIVQTDNVERYIDKGHGVSISRKGVSGATHNQLFNFDMRINNPALTAQVMVACARAAAKQKPGAYTLIELPPIDMLYGERETLIKELV